jgi:hypothetical protein
VHRDRLVPSDVGVSPTLLSGDLRLAVSHARICSCNRPKVVETVFMLDLVEHTHYRSCALTVLEPRL